jgi:hypothetical protein
MHPPHTISPPQAALKAEVNKEERESQTKINKEREERVAKDNKDNLVATFEFSERQVSFLSFTVALVWLFTLPVAI